MKREEERILRAILEGMTLGLDQVGRSKTWERMLSLFRKDSSGDELSRNADSEGASPDPERDYYAKLSWMDMPADEFHSAVLNACEEALQYKPTMEYEEARLDIRTVAGMEFESWLEPEELMLLGQQQRIDNLRRMVQGKALRESMAAKAMLRLV